MAGKEVAVNGKVRGSEDQTGKPGAGQDERLLRVIIDLTWKSGKPAGNMALLLRAETERELGEEGARWATGSPVRIKVETSP